MLLEAIGEIEQGLVDADLGGEVLKKRIAKGGQGKSGGFRTILLFRQGKRTVIAHGFDKGKKANITDIELENFKKLAKIILDLSNKDFQKLVSNGEYVEIENDEKKAQE